jgi:hypothetical protein
VAKSFGFSALPRVDLTLGASMTRDKKAQGGELMVANEVRRKLREKGDAIEVERRC